MLYWTKPSITIDEQTGTPISYGYEEIKEETEFDFVPDGDGFEVNMNGISYDEYKENPSDFNLIKGVLYRNNFA